MWQNYQPYWNVVSEKQMQLKETEFRDKRSKSFCLFPLLLYPSPWGLCFCQDRNSCYMHLFGIFMQAHTLGWVNVPYISFSVVPLLNCWSKMGCCILMFVGTWTTLWGYTLLWWMCHINWGIVQLYFYLVWCAIYIVVRY